MPDSLLRVAVVVGGPSGEHDISLQSGAEVLAHLDRDRWSPFIVRITQSGQWCFPKGDDIHGLAEPLALGDGLNVLLDHRPDVVFPVMHGPFGEDGRFQSLMDIAGLRYVGSGVDTSAVAMNKAMARNVLAAAGLQVPNAEVLSVGDQPSIGAPSVIKPLRMGSSVGMSIVQSEAELALALKHACAHDDRVLNEQFVAGRELTAGVLEDTDGTPEALPLVEIRPLTGRFFDYEAKYTPGATEEICPARVSDEMTATVQQIGLTAHRALGCRGMSRTDVIVDHSGVPWVLETNTIPGMTGTSLLPQAAAAAGIDLPEMLDRMLDRTFHDRL